MQLDDVGVQAHGAGDTPATAREEHDAPVESSVGTVDASKNGTGSGWRT